MNEDGARVSTGTEGTIIEYRAITFPIAEPMRTELMGLSQIYGSGSAELIFRINAIEKVLRTQGQTVTRAFKHSLR